MSESNNNGTLISRAAFGGAWAAGLVSAVIAVLLAVFYAKSQAADPLTNPNIAELQAKLKTAGQDEVLKDKIRQESLNLRLEQANLRQNLTVGLWLLVGFLGLAILCLQVGWSLRKESPAPAGGVDPIAQQTKSVSLARYAVLGGAAALLATAVILAVSVPKYQPLTLGPGGSAATGPSPAGSQAVAAKIPQPAEEMAKTTAGVDYATEEEMLKNWPQFRGPGGLARTDGDYPTKWDGKAGTNILWKSPVPLDGKSSPLVWGDKVFLAAGDGKKQAICCLDAKTGKQEWSADVPLSAKEYSIMPDTGYAPCTPVTDGKNVCAIFPSGDLAAVDFSGKLLWGRALGLPINGYGHASSLAVWHDLAIVQFDQSDQEKSAIIAFQISSGAEAWRTPRPITGSWTSPIVAKTTAGEQIITAGLPFVIGYDPATGTELWRFECLAGDVTPSPAYADGLAFACQATAELAAIKVDGAGDVSKTHEAWKSDENLPDVVSPLADGKFVYTLTTSGTLTVFQAADGKKSYEKDLDMAVNASPIAVGQKVYVLGLNGRMMILQAGAEFKELARCELGEDCSATPAFAGGKIFVRGKENLFCIGNR